MMLKRLNFGSSGALSSMTDGVVREITWLRTLFVVVGLFAFALITGLRSPPLPSGWFVGPPGSSFDGNSSAKVDSEAKWNTWTTRAEEWQINLGIQTNDPNWVGRQKHRNQLVNGSLWWDEKAAEFYIAKLEANQFPADCSQVHWLAHFEFVAGLLSSVHMLQYPLFFGMARGFPVIPIAQPGKDPAFDGCGPNHNMHNMQCYFNITGCQAIDDPARWEKIQVQTHEKSRISWEEVIMEDPEFFAPAGLTVLQTWKQGFKDRVCVGSSIFENSNEAYNYHKFKMWEDMGRVGKVGTVKGPFSNGIPVDKCFGHNLDSKQRRSDLVMMALMSSWMLNRVAESVKMVANDIMSRYSDEYGRPLWQPPVLAIHVRQTDKYTEDPYFQAHNKFRPIEDYALTMQTMEAENGFEWPSIFILSDSGTAMDTLVGIIQSNNSRELTENSTADPEGFLRRKERYIMYDWTTDEHLLEKYQKHTKVPAGLKHDMQTHFLATLYILQQIADHAIVTYSSNVGRFIGEVLAAKNRVAFAEARGPIVTSLDYPWFS